MLLSIIIVNYNVQHFLEQCLYSVERAIDSLEAEVIVVDNDSKDQSCSLISSNFPWVKLIKNEVNVGFSKANNQGIRIANGKYILLLNPDTIVEEQTFKQCIEFMEQEPMAGALGVKMLDGTGSFLPESKRGLPTPFVAFWKVFGFSKLFPKSKIFGQYHLSYLPMDVVNEVDVLSGAYFFIRAECLKKSGLLDEDFFMYGEDIDLSYRIQKAGYKNYYFPKARIIHYKGESTKKGSLNYVRVFYSAMIIFAKKHFGKSQASFFNLLIQFAVFFRASIDLLTLTLKSTGIWILDFLLGFSSLYLVKEIWENHYMHNDQYYKPIFTFVFIPAYILIWQVLSWLSGSYDKPYSTNRILRGILLGTASIYMLFGLFPNEWRFSRMIILMGSVSTFIAFLSSRLFLNSLSSKSSNQYFEKSRLIIVGSFQESQRVLSILSSKMGSYAFLGFCGPKNEADKQFFLGSYEQINHIISGMMINDVVFCAKDVPIDFMIDKMIENNQQAVFKIVANNSNSIVGSNSKETSGEIISGYSSYQIDMPASKRKKRLLDILLCAIFPFLLPLLFLRKSNYKKIFLNYFQVLFGLKTWVSYNENITIESHMPKLKTGVFGIITDDSDITLSTDLLNKLMVNYVRDYDIHYDIKILRSALKI